MDITGKSVIVTGGASGLGLATAARLQAAGARVVIVDLPSSNGEAVAKELGDGVSFAAADVTDEPQVEDAVDSAVRSGPFAAVVNCADIANGIRVVSRDGAPFPLDSFRKVVEVNLIGTFNVIRVAPRR